MKELQDFILKVLGEKAGYNSDREITSTYLAAVKDITINYINKGLVNTAKKEEVEHE